MNRKKAKEIAYKGDVTFGELSVLLSRCDENKPCKVNKNISRKQALDIMSGAIKGKNPNEKPCTTWLNTRDKITLTGQGINVMNILIESG